jgi:hypothetical protein
MLVSYCLHVVCRLRWPDFALAVPLHMEIRIRVRSAFARCRTQGDGGTSRSAVAIGGEMRGGQASCCATGHEQRATVNCWSWLMQVRAESCLLHARLSGGLPVPRGIVAGRSGIASSFFMYRSGESCLMCHRQFTPSD